MHIHYLRKRLINPTWIFISGHHNYCQSNMNDTKNKSYMERIHSIKQIAKDNIRSQSQNELLTNLQQTIKNTQDHYSPKIESTKESISESLKSAKKSISESIKSATMNAKLNNFTNTIKNNVTDTVNKTVSAPINEISSKVTRQIKWLKVSLVIMIIIICICGALFGVNKVLDMMLKIKKLNE